ncbi:MAG TPA: GAF domain-containing SpoIIE family protein phosphatase [Terriglobales bacterium]|nr:GAF domain-containing SpoIIE family protein phosphatase [Terriglobales bacterium]
MSSVETQKPPADVEALLLQVADVVNTTLDLDTILRRIAELIRRIIDYEIFAILLLNEKTQELRFRFAIGYSQDVVERTRIKVGQGVTGRAVARREPVLVNDVHNAPEYIEGHPHVRSELAIPLIFKNRVIGVIDIEAPQADYFTPEHAHTLTVIASRIAIGIEHARLYTRVSRQAKTLQLLNEISREITSILNVDELLKRIAEDLSRIIDYQMFSILLLDDAGKKLEHRFSIRFKENINIKKQIPFGQGIVGYAAEYREPVLVPDVTKDPRYINVNPETRSELAVPLIYKGKVIGVLDLEHTRRRYFNEDHLRTLSTLAAQIAVAIENARLYEQIARQEQRLEHDLALAREVQFRLLPAGYPPLRSAQIAAKFLPAQAIGGDLYDFVGYPVTPGCTACTAVAVGDVSGKGPAAALYAALVSGILRSHAAERPGAADMLRRINASLMERRVDSQYLTMMYAIWRDDQKTLQVANSGMPRPIYCHDGHVERIEATGLPLGLFDKVEYDELTFQGKPGDVFLFFSDGISDATSPHSVLFGRARVEEVVRDHCQATAGDIVAALFDAISKHVAGAAQFDDQTVVALKVTDSAVASSP